MSNHFAVRKGKEITICCSSAGQAALQPGKVTVVHLPLAGLASQPPSLPSRMWLLSGPVLASKNNLAILKSPPLELFFTAFLDV